MDALTMMFALESANHRPSVERILLREYSTMQIGGEASAFRIATKEKIKEAVDLAKKDGLSIFILGGGSNVVFPDQGYDGLVIKLESKGIAVEGNVITAEAGEEWDAFVAWTLVHGYYGLENLSGIPGTVGAAPIQNIGAYGVEVKDLIESVEVFDTEDLAFKVLINKECEFEYRTSTFKKPEGKRYIVTSVKFRLSQKFSPKITYKDLDRYFEGNANPTPDEVREAVLEIRSRKFPNLKTYGTAGSFFKNVICEAHVADRLHSAYPDMPVFNASNGMKKISTAFIIDKICGLHGLREGNVGLYANQSLVVVNYGGATAEEIKNFILKVKSIVKEKTGIILEEEVVML